VAYQHNLSIFEKLYFLQWFQKALSDYLHEKNFIYLPQTTESTIFALKELKVEGRKLLKR
jgi:hypothetical protein